MDLDIGPEPNRSAGGLLRSLTRMLATLVALAQTRLELLTTELQEEVQRAAELLMLAFIALLAAGAGVIFIGITIIIAFWDGPKLLAAILVTSGFLLLAVIAVAVLMSKYKRKPKLLAATREELEKDRESLESRS